MVREGVYDYSSVRIVKVNMFVVRARECAGCHGVGMCGVCVWIWVGGRRKLQDQTEHCLEGHRHVHIVISVHWRLELLLHILPLPESSSISAQGSSC